MDVTSCPTCPSSSGRSGYVFTGLPVAGFAAMPPRLNFFNPAGCDGAAAGAVAAVSALVFFIMFLSVLFWLRRVHTLTAYLCGKMVSVMD
jgi:hypothetical protein